MQTLDAIRTRQSIRAFEDREVPRELIEEIVADASWSPSYKNSQPWEVIVLAGEKKNSLSEFLVDLWEGRLF